MCNKANYFTSLVYFLQGFAIDNNSLVLHIYFASSFTREENAYSKLKVASYSFVVAIILQELCLKYTYEPHPPPHPIS